MILTIFLMLMMSLFTISAQAQDDSASPDLSIRGPYTVGTRDFVIEDAERPLNVTVWYPAQNPDAAEQTTSYGSMLVGITGRALREANPEPGLYPLVIYSHGSGTSRWLHLYLTEHLASHGFVVIAPDHPGNTFNELLNTDTFIGRIPADYTHRPQDVRRVTDYAATLNDELNGIIDTDTLALIGYSFGGYTVARAAGGALDFDALAAYCATATEEAGGIVTPRLHTPEQTYNICPLLDNADDLSSVEVDALDVDALILLAPWNAPIFGENGLAAITAPTLVMVGTNDGVTPAARDGLNYHAWLGSETKPLVTFEDADHYIFMDECPALFARLGNAWACTDEAWAMPDVHAHILQNVTVFLRHTLMDEGAPLPTETTYTP